MGVCAWKSHDCSQVPQQLSITCLCSQIHVSLSHFMVLSVTNISGRMTEICLTKCYLSPKYANCPDLQQFLKLPSEPFPYDLTLCLSFFITVMCETVLHWSKTPFCTDRYILGHVINSNYIINLIFLMLPPPPHSS